ncbi:phosphoglycerate mutase family protein [Heyndrickxia oleronia]|uniref:Phosphoglycerate mutase family protein n=1 Tax=Heyndrickxia oleronia TaxID=38875 RepID=A0AAW6SW36_9BACI|nr:histidine phosphatase family protein [Heyndrickxia oleronia]MCM3236105.1 phosphoglycerate mutase family protein [Heyndrickxia oleronia]MDH5162358.1 phosphoglycerate mutase family protein [Heyndrickxia oleronia]
MSKIIYLVRHCQAEGQKFDADLTPKGIEQSLLLSEFFVNKNIDMIISSPYKRAIKSATPFAQTISKEIFKDDRLSERVLSSKDHSNWYEMLEDSFTELDLCYPGGESSKQAMNRGITVIEDVLTCSSNHIMLVTHGNLMALMIKHFQPSFGFKQWHQLSNPDVYSLVFEDNIPKIQRLWID